MKKQIIITSLIITTLIFGMSLVNAMDIVAGTSYSFQSEQFEYWDVVGNSSNMEGMTIDWANGNTTMYFDVLYQPDSFTLILFNNDTEVIVEHHYSGGGISRRTIYKTNTVYDTETVYVDVPIVTDDEDDGIDPIVITPPEPEGNLNWLLILVGALAFVLFLIIIYFIGKKADKDEKKADKADDLLDSLYDKDIEY